ncbi:MAG: hypothetical protein LBS35_07405 [Synergistaceae bacterium]|jgi:hypothetical protein|nr:hypothetical protein [Synergistaceae bacterium]
MTTAPDTHTSEMSLNYEKVWSVVQEIAKQIKETNTETARQMRETDRRIKETNEQIGRLGNRFGELAEHLVAPNLLEKFRARGFKFTRYSPNTEIQDEEGQLLAEIDIFLENGDCVMVVEVKAQLKTADIDAHAERMQILRRYADKHGDKRKYYGAVAAAIVRPKVKERAVNMGFYVAAQSGDTMTIDVPEGFKPKAW